MQIRQMFAASHTSLFIGVLLALLLAYLQYEVIDASIVVIWLSIFICISLFRIATLIEYHRTSEDDDLALFKSLHKFRLGVFVSGLAWGASSFMLFPANNLQHQMFLIFILAGLTAGGIVSFSADLLSAVGYALTVLVPALVRLFIVQDSLSNAMGLAGLLYLLFIIFTSRFIHRSISENCRLRLEVISREKKLYERTTELELHNLALSQINLRIPLPDFLNHIMRLIEERHPEMVLSVLLFDNDGKTLRQAVAPSLQEFYLKAFVGMQLGDEQERKGTAPFRSRRILVDDVQQHPYWAEYIDLARLAVIHACWSQPFKNKDGKLMGIFAIYHRIAMPISENKLLLLDRYANLARTVVERYHDQNELRIAATAFESQESLMITDANRLIIRVNQAFVEETGYAADEVVNKSPRILSSGRHDADFYKSMWACIDRNGVWQGEVWDRRKNGEIYPKLLTITAVKGIDSKVVHYVGTHIDITDRKVAEEKIKHLAYFDPLTSLPNRRLLMDRLQQAVSSVTRSGRAGALLFIDLDNFKTLNDTLGHDVGDLLLQEVAKRLNACVREGDTVARLGGDEFVVMLENLNEMALEAAAQTRTIGNHIITSLTEIYQLATHEYHSTPSIGVTLFGENKISVDELLKQADIAMYQAKKAGRNTLRFFDTHMQDAINSRATLEGELHNALSNQQFQLYYQIQVDVNQQPLGAETLIRWKHPEHGMVSPAQFIPLAEELGLILPIGEWVLETACKQLKIWESHPTTCDLVLAVNVSAKQFNQPSFVAQISAMVKCFDINPTRLKLELTESMLVENIEEIILCMSTLKKLGIQFSLDDFGTGYSSLQYLQKMPLDQLKIDQSFVRNLSSDRDENAIVRTIVAMAKGLNLHIIAEGVETEEQRELLLGLGCENFQGYLFSKPVPLFEFEALLKMN